MFTTLECRKKKFFFLFNFYILISKTEIILKFYNKIVPFFFFKLTMF